MILKQKPVAHKNLFPYGSKTHIAVIRHNHLANLSAFVIAICLAILALGAGATFRHIVDKSNINTVPLVSEEQYSASTGKSNTKNSQSMNSLPITGDTRNNVASLPSSRELQQTLNNWQADYPGYSFGAVVQELDSPFGYASINADESFHLASIYKLYLAYYIYNQLETKQLSGNENLGANHTVNTCIRLMLIYSDNTCGESIGYFVGWTKLSYWLNYRGYTETSTSTPFDTTAKDTTKILNGLQSGTLINSADTKQMLNLMRQQITRIGVPAGVPGIPVADRVGILNGYWNDAAIVYNQKGTYILVVMTKDSGPAPIKDLSSRLNSLFAVKH